VLMTVGVYGLVAGIVKLDDLGLMLVQTGRNTAQAVGRGILALAPLLMKFLSFAGTVAMFLVGGGILTHGWPALHHAIEHTVSGWTSTGWLQTVLASTADFFVGVAAGAVIVLAVALVRRFRGGTHAAPAA
jgi:uncharacterized protein